MLNNLYIIIFIVVSFAVNSFILAPLTRKIIKNLIPENTPNSSNLVI